MPSNDSPHLARLRETIRSLDSALVAFSGGVDSALLLRVAHDELGKKAFALTALSPSLAAGEREEAVRFAAGLGVRHFLVDSAEMEIP